MKEENSGKVNIWDTSITRIETIKFLRKAVPHLYVRKGFDQKRTNTLYHKDDEETKRMVFAANEEIERVFPKYARTKLMSSIVITNPTIAMHIGIIADLLNIEYCYSTKSNIDVKESLFRVLYRDTHSFKDIRSNVYFESTQCFFLNASSFTYRKLLEEMHVSLLKKFMRSGCDILYIDVPEHVMNNVMQLLLNSFYCKSQFYKYGETLREPMQ